MARVETPPIEVTLKLTLNEAEALYFLLVNEPRGGTYIERLQSVVDALAEHRKQLYQP